MIINLAFFILIIISAIRTVAYGIYSFKNEGKTGGVSVFTLAGLSLFTGAVILITQILQ